AVFVTVAAAVLAPGRAPAQFGQQQQTTGMFQFPASVSARVTPSVAFPGETVTVEVQLTIEEGYYTYSIVPPENPGPVPTKASLSDLAEGPLEEIEGKGWE